MEIPVKDWAEEQIMFLLSLNLKYENIISISDLKKFVYS